MSTIRYWMASEIWTGLILSSALKSAIVLATFKILVYALALNPKRLTAMERLEVAEKIYHQQREMYKRKVNRVKERIVSFHRPYVRPIKRGKVGRSVEFGGKGALVHVGGFLFLDYFAHEAFAEEQFLAEHLLGYVERFGKLPPYMSMDGKYGTQENRDFGEERKVRASFKPRGRPLGHKRQLEVVDDW